jgi:hypothetical protein
MKVVLSDVATTSPEKRVNYPYQTIGKTLLPNSFDNFEHIDTEKAAYIHK